MDGPHPEDRSVGNDSVVVLKENGCVAVFLENVSFNRLFAVCLERTKRTAVMRNWLADAVEKRPKDVLGVNPLDVFFVFCVAHSRSLSAYRSLRSRKSSEIFVRTVSSIWINGGHGLLNPSPASLRVASTPSFVPIAISEAVFHRRDADDHGGNDGGFAVSDGGEVEDEIRLGNVQ